MITEKQRREVASRVNVDPTVVGGLIYASFFALLYLRRLYDTQSSLVFRLSDPLSVALPVRFVFALSRLE